MSDLHAPAHFVLLQINIEEHLLSIYDGLQYQLKIWLDHCTNILKCCKLIPIDKRITDWEYNEARQEYVLIHDNIRWKLLISDAIIPQLNHYDCGQIICLHIMHIFGRLPPLLKKWTI